MLIAATALLVAIAVVAVVAAATAAVAEHSQLQTPLGKQLPLYQKQLQEMESDWILVLLFYAIATVFRLYHGGDMIYEMRRRKPEPTLILTQGIFNLPDHTGWYESNWPLMTL